MRSYFFGNDSRQRLAVYHEAPRETADHAVLICAPIGQEYLRTHWALRKLAGDLSRSGFPVMRFDYTGTGDSAGDLSDASVDAWTEDVCDAASELRDASGASRVSVVGLRFGAALAALAASQKIKVWDLVLWDAVISGAEYVASLRRMQRRMLIDPLRFPKPLLERFQRGEPRAFPVTANEVLGFFLPPALATDIESVDLVKRPPVRARRILLIDSSDDVQTQPLSAALRAADVPSQSTIVNDTGDWDDPTRIEDALICQSIPARIVAFLSRSADVTVARASHDSGPA